MFKLSARVRIDFSSGASFKLQRLFCMAPSKEEHQMVHVCKPNFVPGKSRVAVIYLAAALLPRSSGLPEGVQGEQPCLRENPAEILLLDLAPSGVCPADDVTIDAVGSYPAFSPLSG